MSAIFLVLVGVFSTASASGNPDFPVADPSYTSCFNSTLLRLMNRFEDCTGVLQAHATPDGSSVGAAVCTGSKSEYLLLEVPNRYRGKTAAEIDVDPWISPQESVIIARSSARPACVGESFFVVDITELNP